MSFIGGNISARLGVALLFLGVLALMVYALAPAASGNPVLLAGATLVVGLLSGAAYLASTGLYEAAVRSRGYRKVGRAMERLADGDYDSRLSPGIGVPGDMAESFNNMADRLGAVVKALEDELRLSRGREEVASRFQEQSGRLEEQIIRTNSELLRKEVMLEEINQELLAASRVKSKFISNMGRELKTPLSSIIGLADFVNSGILGGVNDKQREYIGNIRGSAKDLLDTVDNILEYTLIETGEALRPEEVDARAVCEEAAAALRPFAASRGVSIDIDVPEARLSADRKKLKFILHDLLHNAIKFNRPGGKAVLRAYLTDGSGEGAPGPGGPATLIEFQVEDTGPGFTSSQALELFRPFSQIVREPGKKPSGAGLSLALVKKYVELHNGRVWADGKPGKGSRFSFVLPISQGPPSVGHVKKVLVVEDDPDHMALMMKYFMGEPYTMLKASNGLEALGAVEEEEPDLILLDVLLPKMDGIEVCRTLKRQEKFGRYRRTPIIIITSLSDLDSKVRGIQAGADDFLVKPLNRDIVVERVRSLIRSKEEYERMLASYRDVEKDSVLDPLTGLFNRRHMDDVLDREFKNSERHGRNLSVLMADIDFFKNYNDRHGHQEGDRLLKKLAGVFTENVREVDVVARYGGEEFVVILPETPPDMAMVVAERIRKSVAGSAGVTISLGVATYPEDSETADGLVEKADVALYRAKDAGRNRVEKFRQEPGSPVPMPVAS